MVSCQIGGTYAPSGSGERTATDQSDHPIRHPDSGWSRGTNTS